MQIPGIHYTWCGSCRRRIPKGISLMKYVKIGGSYKKVCGNCYSSMGNPGQLSNVIALREREKLDRKRREASYKDKRRRYRLDTRGKRYKKGGEHPKNPNQQALF